MHEHIDAREMIFIKALMKTNQDNRRLCTKDSTPTYMNVFHQATSTLKGHTQTIPKLKKSFFTKKAVFINVVSKYV